MLLSLTHLNLFSNLISSILFLLISPIPLLNGRNRLVHVRLLNCTFRGRLNVVIHRDALPLRHVHQILSPSVVVLDGSGR